MAEMGFSLAMVTDTLVMLQDMPGRNDIAGDPAGVLERVDVLVGGLRRRRLIFRDGVGCYREIRYRQVELSGVVSCSPAEQQRFQDWIEVVEND